MGVACGVGGWGLFASCLLAAYVEEGVRLLCLTWRCFPPMHSRCSATN